MSNISTVSSPISDGPSGSHYVEWSAIIAGATLASAIIVLMTAFGSAIGLSIITPYHGPSATIFYIAIALWFTWITVSSFVAGGYVTGRLRRPIEGTTPHEVHIRDGAHGLIVWAVAVVAGTAIATFSLSSAVTTLSLSSPFRGRVDVAKAGLSNLKADAESNSKLMGYQLDVLLRRKETYSPTKSAVVTTTQPNASDILAMGIARGSLNSRDRALVARDIAAKMSLTQADAEKQVDAILLKANYAADKVREATETARKMGLLLSVGVMEDSGASNQSFTQPPNQDSSITVSDNSYFIMQRDEISRILSKALSTGSLSKEDHTHLLQRIGSLANIDQAESESRLDNFLNEMKTTAIKEHELAEKMRKGGVLLAFLTTATMVLGAAAAWWSAGVGGRHRDEQFDASHLIRW